LAAKNNSLPGWSNIPTVHCRRIDATAPRPCGVQSATMAGAAALVEAAARDDLDGGELS